MKPAEEPCSPNSFCTRVTPYAVVGASGTGTIDPVESSTVNASLAVVTAAIAPTDRPELRRPVSFAAPAIVPFTGASTTSPRPLAWGMEPIRRE